MEHQQDNLESYNSSQVQKISVFWTSYLWISCDYNLSSLCQSAIFADVSRICPDIFPAVTKYAMQR